MGVRVGNCQGGGDHIYGSSNSRRRKIKDENDSTYNNNRCSDRSDIPIYLLIYYQGGGGFGKKGPVCGLGMVSINKISNL